MHWTLNTGGCLEGEGIGPKGFSLNFIPKEDIYRIFDWIILNI